MCVCVCCGEWPDLADSDVLLELAAAGEQHVLLQVDVVALVPALAVARRENVRHQRIGPSVQNVLPTEGGRKVNKKSAGEDGTLGRERRRT